MTQNITIGIKHLCQQAEKDIETVTVDDVKEMFGNDDIVLVDIRDIRELKRDGKVPGAYHCPRGMLEFWIDPESPYQPISRLKAQR